MMMVSRLIRTSVRQSTLLRTIISSANHLSDTSAHQNKPSNKGTGHHFTILSLPAKKMNTLKYYQKFWVWTIAGCWVVNAISSTCWLIYEPLTLGMYTNIACFASTLVVPGLFTQNLLSRILGKVSINTKTGKLEVSHLDIFGNRINKDFDASQCFFTATKEFEKCQLPDGKYAVVWKDSSPEEKELLLSMTAKSPVRTDIRGPDKKKAYVYNALVLNTTIVLFLFLSLRVVISITRSQQKSQSDTDGNVAG